MKIKILVANALLNDETGRRGGLYETHDVPKTRGNYLVSIGAAVEVVDGEPEAPSGNATVTQEVDPATGSAPRRQPVTRTTTRTTSKTASKDSKSTK